MSRVDRLSHLWGLLAAAGNRGVHSHDLEGFGDLEQSIAELEGIHQVNVPRRSEMRDKRRGTRFFHPNHAPARSSSLPEVPRKGPGEAAARGRRDQVSLVLNYTDPTKPFEHLADLGETDSIPEVTEAEAREIFASHTNEEPLNVA